MSCWDMERPPRDVLLQLAKDNPVAIVDLVYQLFDIIESLQEKVKVLEAKVSALQNSNKPPSSDRHNSKPTVKSKHRKGNRKPGWQKGHHGHTLKSGRKP